MFYLTATICAISNSFNYPENYINVTFTPTPKHLEKNEYDRTSTEQISQS